MKKSIMKCLLAIIVLVATDIIIKIVIDNFFMGEVRMLFDGFGFKPHLNTTQLSMFNNELDMGVSTIKLIILNIVIIPVIPLSLYFVHRNDNLGNGLYAVNALLLAACICSLIDKVFWGGSLDYIYVDTWIVDLKDMYLVAAIVAYVYCGVKAVIRESRAKKEKE